MLNLAHFLACSEHEGPGKRAVLWLQGCHFNCQGCCNPQLQAFRQANLVTVEAMFAQIMQAKTQHDIEGITLLGGEPMLQAQGLAPLAKRCQQAGLSVMIFSGYRQAQLLKSTEQAPRGSAALLRYTDILVDGLYRQDMPETQRNWCGSSNQQFHYLTERYGADIETDPRYQPTLEIRLHSEHIALNGYPL